MGLLKFIMGLTLFIIGKIMALYQWDVVPHLSIEGMILQVLSTLLLILGGYIIVISATK